MLWVDKYNPNKLSEWIGDPKIKSEVKNYLKGALYKSGLAKCLILEGSPGNGKTSIVYALANDMDLNIIEINASDKRGKNDMMRLIELGYVSGEKRNIILIDEADGIRAWKEVMMLIDLKPCPVILTCNRIDKIDWKIVKRALTVSVPYPPTFVVFDRLKDIAHQEGLDTIKDTDIRRIANKCTNIRGAIYTLQQFSMGQMKKIEALDIEFTIEEKMRRLFGGKQVHLDYGDYYKIFEWGVANYVDNVQLSQYSTLSSFGRSISGMQDMVRMFGDYIRSNISELRIPIPKWKRKYHKDRKLIKKLDNDLTKFKKKNTRKKVKRHVPEKNLEEFF
jgi:DNA polymerase III delta prime subunit